MDFFDIGPGELLLILIVALLLFGPQKIPEIARNIGKVVNGFKKSASEFTSEVTKEIDAANKATAEATAAMNKEIGNVNKAVAEVTTQVNTGLNTAVAQTNKEIGNLNNAARPNNIEPVPQSKLPQSAPLVESSSPPNSPAKL